MDSDPEAYARGKIQPCTLELPEYDVAVSEFPSYFADCVGPTNFPRLLSQPPSATSILKAPTALGFGYAILSCPLSQPVLTQVSVPLGKLSLQDPVHPSSFSLLPQLLK